MKFVKTRYRKNDIDPKARYCVSYKSKHGNYIDTTFHNTASSLGKDVSWLASNGYVITSVRKLKRGK